MNGSTDITAQGKPEEDDVDLLYSIIHGDYICGQLWQEGS
jgi:hypothetical protein